MSLYGFSYGVCRLIIEIQRVNPDGTSHCIVKHLKYPRRWRGESLEEYWKRIDIYNLPVKGESLLLPTSTLSKVRDYRIRNYTVKEPRKISAGKVFTLIALIHLFLYLWSIYIRS